MDVAHVEQVFRQSPFRAFVVHMNNGSAFTVSHPDQAMIVGEVLLVRTGHREIQRCALLNISHIQQEEPAEA